MMLLLTYRLPLHVPCYGCTNCTAVPTTISKCDLFFSLQKQENLSHIFYFYKKTKHVIPESNIRKNVMSSNGNASETKANESFDIGVFFDIEAKRTPSKVSKLFSKRSEHIR